MHSVCVLYYTIQYDTIRMYTGIIDAVVIILY